MTKSSDEDDLVWQEWMDDDPLAMVATHAKSLRTYKLIYLDHGEDETLLGTEDFDRELVRYGIAHVHNIFKGDHVDKMSMRVNRLVRTIALHWRLD